MGQADKSIRAYLWVLMGGLFGQGVGSLVFRLFPTLPASMPLLVRGAFGIDFWHALIHLSWGLVGMAVIATVKTNRPLFALAFAFGVFYTGLAIWGVSVHHPLGLELDLPENAFHWVAGPTSLGVGWLGLKRMSNI